MAKKHAFTVTNAPHACYTYIYPAPARNPPPPIRRTPRHPSADRPAKPADRKTKPADRKTKPADRKSKSADRAPPPAPRIYGPHVSTRKVFEKYPPILVYAEKKAYFCPQIYTNIQSTPIQHAQ